MLSLRPFATPQCAELKLLPGCGDMLQIMTDPVLAEDGQTYELAVVER